MQTYLLPIAAILMSGVTSTAAYSAGLPSGAAHNIVLVHGASSTTAEPMHQIVRMERDADIISRPRP